MKRIASYILRVVLLILLFVSVNDNVFAQSGFGMGNTLKPIGASEFPIVLSNQVMGGLHQVATIAERDAIFEKRRQEGMLCTVLDDGTGATKIYQLLGGVENTNWVELSTGGSSSPVPSGETVPGDGADAGSTFYETDTNIFWVSDGTVWKEVGTGTVKNVSIATANGVSGTVNNATTAPEITIHLGDITPSSVAASGLINAGSGFVGTSLSTTGDADLTLSAGAGKTIVAGSLKTEGAVYGQVRQVETKPTGDADWYANDYVVNIHSAGAGTIVLPNPANWAGRILIICNTSSDIPSGAGTYSYSIYIPVNSASILASKGQMLISDGTKWIMIVGTL